MILWPRVNKELENDPEAAKQIAMKGRDSYLVFESLLGLPPTDPRRRIAMDPKKYVDLYHAGLQR